MFEDISVWIISIFLCIWLAPFSYTFCESNLTHKPCCIGEKWNAKEGKCVACPINHYGDNCTFKCRLPEHGYRCSTGRCTCNRIACNVNNSSPKCVASKAPLDNRTISSRALSVDSINSTVSLGREERSTSKHSTYGILSTTLLIASKNTTVKSTIMKKKIIPKYIVMGCGMIVGTIIVFECLVFIRKKITKGHRQRSREEQPQEPVYSEIILN